MIDEIRAQNVALIRDATLMPAKGLTVLTGETGAGKTALLSACKLLCGERADASAVREDASELSVEGRFYSTEEEFVVNRRVGSDGRSRVSINGSMASVGELQATIGPSVDLCGQHEHQQLLKPATHVTMLDAWADESIAPALKAYQEAFATAGAAASALEEILNAAQSSSAKLEEARFILQRIDGVDPQEGEYEELAASLAKAEHVESLAQASELTYSSLSGDEGAIDAIYRAVAALDSMAAVDTQLGEYAASLREASYTLEDVSREARSYRDSIEFDPAVLEANQERMAALQGLMRAYGPRMEDVFAKRDEVAELISLVDDSSEREQKARASLAAAEAALQDAADALDEARKTAAPQFAEAVNEQLVKLEMGGASIECGVERLDRAQWTKGGPSHVEFLFQPAEGMQARPLARIASGGEISRVMLALKVVLGNADEVETLIFDEVDAGVGGSTAVALAHVLSELAQSHQVIVVTHLAQIAVAGDVHYLVEKQEARDEGLPETVLVELDEEARVNEVARMLSGDATEVSLQHAQELITKARL